MKLSLSLGVALLVSAVSLPGVMLVGLTKNNQLVRFDSARPGDLAGPVPITGLQTDETIVGIDYRPRTGQLYGLGVVHGSSADAVRVYLLDAIGGSATQVPGSTSFTVATGNSYAFDFNPTVDRMRIVHNADENFRIDPNDGERVDTPPDTDLNPAGRSIEAVAYDRNFESGVASSWRTTLYGISRTQSLLVTIGGIDQSPSPNDGAVKSAALHTLGPVISPTGGIGFDISGLSGSAFATWVDKADGFAKLFTIRLISGEATLVGPIGDGSLALEGLSAVPPARLVLAPEGRRNTVNSLDVSTEHFTSVLTSVFPAPHKGGVRVAAGHLNRDGHPDYVVAAGRGRPPLVRAFDGRTGSLLREFFAYPSDFMGGVFVAVGDLNSDGIGDIITAPGPGIVATIKGFSGANGSQLVTAEPFPNFDGGVTVAAIDFDLDGDTEIVVGSGPGLDPEVRVLNDSGFVVTMFSPYSADFKGRGVVVAAGQLRSATLAAGPMIITALAKNSSELKVFTSPRIVPLLAFAEQRAIKAFPGANPGGVRVACLDVDFDGLTDIIALPGPGRSAAQARVFSATDGALLRTFPGILGSNGGFVAAGR